MNRYAEKERRTTVSITLQNALYTDFNLLVLTSLEVTTVTTMDSQEPACCYKIHLLGFLMQLPYKARYGGAKFGRGWDQLMYGSLTLLRAASRGS